jgi:thymidylate synthase
MISVFSGKTADDVWCQAISSLRNDGHCSLQQSRLGPMREILHANLCIENPRERWVTSRVPVINPAFAIAEVFWILAGSNDANFVNFWNPALPKYAGKTSEYYGAYGYRLKKQFCFDQIERAYNVLSNNPNTRQVVLQIWDPETDFPNQDGSPRAEDIPCNICSLLKVRNEKLDWVQIMRSNDLYRGTPYNFIQFTTLQEIIAGWLDVEVGSYCQISDSLHLYLTDLHGIDQAGSLANVATLSNYDDLRLPKDDWDKVFVEAFNLMKLMVSRELTINVFRSIISSTTLPKSYANLLYVVAADCARRHGWIDEMNDAIRFCNNRQLVALWENWRIRKMS